ncbi:hypothetical protein F4778DRAFT_737172 [Xylariomycetidae sp. FL2044]|nr:hypothetical protein F4778DRAFT_737172 [Xylariomycetidae sp. FL2044]
MSKCYEIRQTTSKGYEVFATTDIPVGTRILQETAIFVGKTTASGQALYSADFLEAFEKTFSADQRAAVLDLSEHRQPAYAEPFGQIVDQYLSTSHHPAASQLPAEQCLKALYTYASNSFGGQLFLVLSRFNHSCAPNAGKSAVGGPDADADSDTTSFVHATRDIARGEEITLAYIHPWTEGRAAKLARVWGIAPCACPVCDGADASMDAATRARYERVFSQLQAWDEEDHHRSAGGRPPTGSRWALRRHELRVEALRFLGPSLDLFQELYQGAGLYAADSNWAMQARNMEMCREVADICLGPQ